LCGSGRLFEFLAGRSEQLPALGNGFVVLAVEQVGVAIADNPSFAEDRHDRPQRPPWRDGASSAEGWSSKLGARRRHVCPLLDLDPELGLLDD